MLSVGEGGKVEGEGGTNIAGKLLYFKCGSFHTQITCCGVKIVQGLGYEITSCSGVGL